MNRNGKNWDKILGKDWKKFHYIYWIPSRNLAQLFNFQNFPDELHWKNNSKTKWPGQHQPTRATPTDQLWQHQPTRATPTEPSSIEDNSSSYSPWLSDILCLTSPLAPPVDDDDIDDSLVAPPDDALFVACWPPELFCAAAADGCCCCCFARSILRNLALRFWNQTYSHR